MATQSEIVRSIGNKPAEARETNLSPKQQVQSLLKSNKNKIAQILPKHLSPERLMQVAFHAVTSNPTLLKCDQNSLIGAIIQSAMLGLEPNTVLGQCYLIPFWNGRKRHYEVQFMMGYRGMITLARRSGEIQSITAQAVFENDDFEFEYGINERLKHVPASGDRGEITHFYAYAKVDGGGHQFVVMTRDDVDRVRDNSQGYKRAVEKNRTDTPWIQHYEPMGQKTAVRRLFKWLPCSIEMAAAEALDAMAEHNTDQNLDKVLDGEFSVVDEGVDGTDPDDDPDGPAGGAIAQDEPAKDPDTGETVSPGAKANESPREKMLREFGFYQDPDSRVITNKHGEVFDREAHAATEDGAPIVNTDGSFRKKPGAAKKSPSQEEEQAPQAKAASNNKSAQGDAFDGEDDGTPF